METKARLHDVMFDAKGKQIVTFCLDHRQDVSELRDKDIRLKAVRWREKRSLDANGLLWVCLDKIAAALNTDKWEVYLTCLKRYGKFSYCIVPTGAVEDLRKMWRETEIVGEIDVNGRKATQVCCYFGSSTYDTAEFSRLLSGVISEMEEMGIPTPEQEETERILKEWEEHHRSS